MTLTQLRPLAESLGLIKSGSKEKVVQRILSAQEPS